MIGPHQQERGIQGREDCAHEDLGAGPWAGWLGARAKEGGVEVSKLQ